MSLAEGGNAFNSGNCGGGSGDVRYFIFDGRFAYVGIIVFGKPARGRVDDQLYLAVFNRVNDVRAAFVHLQDWLGCNSFCGEKFMYYFLKEDFKDNPRVTFHISDGYHFYLEVYGFNIRIHHGHSVRYNGGVGGLTIPMNKKIQIWNIANPAYLDLVGH